MMDEWLLWLCGGSFLVSGSAIWLWFSGVKSISFTRRDPGEISDGYHTFNDLYLHRHMLLIAFMINEPTISWRSRQHHDGTMFDGLFIAGVDLGMGQISYHLPVELWALLNFSGVATLINAPEWDGHMSDDVLGRLYGYVDKKRGWIGMDFGRENSRNLWLP